MAKQQIKSAEKEIPFSVVCGSWLTVFRLLRPVRVFSASWWNNRSTQRMTSRNIYLLVCQQHGQRADLVCGAATSNPRLTPPGFRDAVASAPSFLDWLRCLFPTDWTVQVSITFVTSPYLRCIETTDGLASGFAAHAGVGIGASVDAQGDDNNGGPVLHVQVSPDVAIDQSFGEVNNATKVGSEGPVSFSDPSWPFAAWIRPRLCGVAPPWGESDQDAHQRFSRGFSGAVMPLRQQVTEENCSSSQEGGAHGVWDAVVHVTWHVTHGDALAAAVSQWVPDARLTRVDPLALIVLSVSPHSGAGLSVLQLAGATVGVKGSQIKATPAPLILACNKCDRDETGARSSINQGEAAERCALRSHLALEMTRVAVLQRLRQEEQQQLRHDEAGARSSINQVEVADRSFLLEQRATGTTRLARQGAPVPEVVVPHSTPAPDANGGGSEPTVEQQPPGGIHGGGGGGSVAVAIPHSAEEAEAISLHHQNGRMSCRDLLLAVTGVALLIMTLGGFVACVATSTFWSWQALMFVALALWELGMAYVWRSISPETPVANCCCGQGQRDMELAPEHEPINQVRTQKDCNGGRSSTSSEYSAPGTSQG